MTNGPHQSRADVRAPDEKVRFFLDLMMGWV